MRQGINIILGLAVGFVLLFSACVRETETGNPDGFSGEPATVMIGAGPRSLTGHYLDNKIVTLRILTFTPHGLLADNTFYSAEDLQVDPTAEGPTYPKTITHVMRSGDYDFVFIANESFDGVYERRALEEFVGNKRKEDLNDIYFDRWDFNEDDPIPMVAEVNNVKVYPDREGIVVDGVHMTEWGVELKRLGVRLDMILRSNIDLGDKINQIQFRNIADKVPLFGEYNGSVSIRTYSSEYELSRIIRELAPGEISPQYVWGRKVERIILPSHIFSIYPEENLLIMDLGIEGWNTTPSTIISYFVYNAEQFILPANTHFKGEGIIGPLLQLNLEPEDWTGEKIGGAIGRTLNVSAFYKNMASNAAVRIYFNSNQEFVAIEPTVRGLNPYGNYDTFRTDQIFKSITGEEAANFSYTYDYTTHTGTGYVDLMVTATASRTRYKLHLNAGGLVRELSINVYSPIN